MAKPPPNIFDQAKVGPKQGLASCLSVTSSIGEVLSSMTLAALSFTKRYSKRNSAKNQLITISA